MLPCSKQGKRNDRCHHFQVSLRTQVTLRYVEEGMASLTFFISCIIRPVYMVVFVLHSFLLTLSGNSKYGQQLLPDNGKFILSGAPNHETGTTPSTIW